MLRSSTAPSVAGGGGGIGFGDFWLSPAGRGVVRSAGQAGNFTVGMRFRFLRPCTWTGVRFGGTWAGNKTWKARAYDVTASSALATATSASIAAGGITHDVLFGSPVAITAMLDDYVVSIYETGAGIFLGYAPPGAPDTWAANAIIGLNVMLIDNTYFAAGDAQPTSGGSSQYMAVEPISTVP